MNRITAIIVFVLVSTVLVQAGIKPKKKYDDDWQSLKTLPIPDWFNDDKFGIFIHWGPYSVIGHRKGGTGYAEHVPKIIYAEPDYYYPYLQKHFGGHPPEFGYKDIIKQFKAENWDPQAWAELFDKAGAKYVVLTAEHHDGYALWDSELTQWCAAKIGPMRDLVGDLGKAVRARGLRYAPSYHRERHTGFFAMEKYAVKSPPRPDIAEEIRRHPQAADLYGPFEYSDEFISDYVARWKEIQMKYQPDFMWIDDIPIFYWSRESRNHPQTQKYKDACRGMITDYLNAAEEWGKDVYLNNKGKNLNWPDGIGCYEKDNLQMDAPGPKWQSPATLATSFGYMAAEEEKNLYQSSEKLIHLLCDVVSKNGNLLLNIGPRSDGTIPQGMQDRLLGIGQWLDVNGEAIYSTRPWKTYGEGVIPNKKKRDKYNRHTVNSTGIRFTSSKDGKVVYAILLECPNKPVVIKSFKDEKVADVKLLGSDQKLLWNMTDEGLNVALPTKNTCEYAFVLKVDIADTCQNACCTDSPCKRSISIDTTEQWLQAKMLSEGINFEGGLATPTSKVGHFQSVVWNFKEKRSAKNIVLRQSPVWHNWRSIDNLGPGNLEDAPVLLSLGPDNYWIFGRYRLAAKKGFKSKVATLEGFDIPLKTTPFPNQFDAPGGLKKGLGGYHAWQSRDMVNWVHHGPVTEEFSRWVTTAEYVDGKTHIYYDYPNDQDPHLYIDEDLTDGVPGKNMGMAFKDPSHGSDCAMIRDLEGRIHVIYEDWSPINARKHAWDSPLAGHAVSADGISDFKILPPAVDLRTTPTGEVAQYLHPHWKQHPDWDSNVGKYNVHKPEQDAFGDWAAICIGGQYYIFGDYHPAKGHMRAAWFTSSSLDKEFSLCGEIGNGHPDPDIAFAEGQFYLATQMKTDYVSPGPWVEKVEARVGVDTNKDGKIDQWTAWKEVKETYTKKPGFARIVETTPASIDLKHLPAGYGFKYEFKMTDTTENQSKPIMAQVILSFQ